jgi:hypothetical protein
MHRRLANPNWPVEPRGGEHLRRFGLPYFVLASVLVHGLALLLKFDFRPFFPVDRGTSRLDILLAPALHPDVAKPPENPELIGHPHQVTRNNPHRETAVQPARIEMAPSSPQSPPSAAEEDAGTLIARGKAMLNTSSRRQMVDPMFAPSAEKYAAASPIERATAIRDQTIEHLGDRLIRVTTAGGQRYCLQGLPEAATRDIPVPVLSVPGNCP